MLEQTGTFLETKQDVADYLGAKLVAMGNYRTAILITPTEHGYYVDAFEVELP